MTDVNVKVEASQAQRAQQIFDQRYDKLARRTDRLFVYLLLAQWIATIIAAIVIAPYAWEGKSRAIHAHVYIAVVFGVIINSLPIYLAAKRPGRLVTRLTIGAAQLLWTGLLIQTTGGRLETHFHVFVSLAFLSFYRDWRVLVPATVVVLVDHVARQFLWPESIFGITAPETWRFLEHAGWVVFEDSVLIVACISGLDEMKNVASQQAQIEEAERLRLAAERAIASHIQTSILPSAVEVPGLDIAAKMIPAEDIGGDYYDIFRVSDGCWLGIGDVAGHGLTAGVVMLQAQSAISALVRQDPNRSPREVLTQVNAVLYENVRRRMASNEHVTMSLVRYFSDGRVVSAGAHEEAVIWRASSRTCERLPVAGPWVAVVEDIGDVTIERTDQLFDGDVLVLYTDGVTESFGPKREQFGVARLCGAIERVANGDVARIRDTIFSDLDEWTGGVRDDDQTVLVMRHHQRNVAP